MQIYALFPIGKQTKRLIYTKKLIRDGILPASIHFTHTYLGNKDKMAYICTKNIIMAKKTSLQDIADRLKVSKTTVSWTLSGQGDAKGVKQETQEKVRQCARAMNYRPNLLARSLNTGLSRILGLIIPDITDSFFSTIARHIEIEAEKNGYSLMIASSESDQKRENQLLSMFQDRQVDGIIIAPTQDSEDKIRELVMEEEYPIVVIDRIFPELNIDSVCVDNRHATQTIVQDMIKDGARHIAFLTTNPHIYTMRERYLGYTDALSGYGMKINGDLIRNVSFVNYEDEIFNVLDHIMLKGPMVDGIFFTTHVLAMEAFRYFTERGIDFNSRFCMGCIHANSAFKVMAPGIRVARMPIEKIGSSAVEIAVNCINKRHNNELYSPTRIIHECTYPRDLNIFKKR